MSVLMLGYMNRSQSKNDSRDRQSDLLEPVRKKLWTKGETSGNYLQVREISADCDRDAILVKARAFGPTCHTGKRSCFSWKLREEGESC